MSLVPEELYYLESHEWARLEEDGTVTVGITDHAQEALGDMVFVETPEVDSEVDQGDGVAVVESVKAASDVYAPLSGTIVDSNQLLVDAPETVNSDPYGDGWIYKIKPNDEDDLENLWTADQYSESIADDE